MTRAAIYTRISSDPTRERLGVQSQEAECRALCASKRWTVEAVYEDDDRSAYSGKRRPAYDAMLDAIAAGQIGAVVAWHPDRLHRAPIELEDFITLIETTGAKVATVQTGEYDLSTPSGRMSARIVGAVARGESEHKSERAKLKARDLAKRGRISGGGTRPFGYETDRRTIRPAEAVLIREAVDRILAGDALYAICKDWNERGVRTVTGQGTWRTSVLRRLVSAGRIAGWREHRGILVTEAEWPAIVPLDQLHAVRALLADPDRLQRRTSRRYLLTGIVYCELCGAKLIARPTEDKAKQYVCSGGVNFSGCGRISCRAAGLDDLVAEALHEALRGIDLDDRFTPATPEPVRAEVEDVEQRLDELAEMFASGEIGRREWAKAREALDDRLSRLRADETATVTNYATLSDAANLKASTAHWDDLPIQRQRDLIAMFIERVVLGPAVRGRNFFDPTRVSIVWRS